MKALALSLGLAVVAHSAALTAAILPTLGAIVAAETVYVATLARRRRIAR